MSKFCEFRSCVDMLAQECVQCYRVIADRTIVQNRSAIFPLTCGVPSIYDDRSPLKLNVKRREPITNELLGQEGGKWDSFYMEESL